MIMRKAWLLFALFAVQVGCTRGVPQHESSSSRADASISGTVRDAAVFASAAVAPVSEEKVLHFEWKPAQAKASEYAMSDPRDQHRVWLLRGVQPQQSYPVVVAFHGQPRRGQLPRNYAFPVTVAEVARELLESGAVAPFVLVTPVFRFEGQNWPKFDSREFVRVLSSMLAQDGISIGKLYFVGHSGAAGCGGSGLNGIESAEPSGVGFFDTCLGTGFVNTVRQLARMRVPTLIVHSVETAGFQPREPTEYESQFDFGRVYSKLGLRPGLCPEHLPSVPLRRLAYQCASNESATTRALVIDTGEGEKAHEAAVPVALRYFLTEYVGRSRP